MNETSHLSHILVNLARANQQLHVGNPKPHVLVVGPETKHRFLLRALVAGVKIGVAHAAQVSAEADEDVPAAVEVLEADQVAQVPVDDPAEYGEEKPHG